MQKMLNEIIDRDFAQLVADTRELVAIPSTLDEGSAESGAPFGIGIRKALELGLAKAAAMGFETKNLDGFAGYAQYGTTGDLVAVLAHMDVVPATGDWDMPPYSAEIRDGRLYGRGSVDDKGPGMACLYAMKAIRESGLPIQNRVRLIWGTDEETFARGIYYYLEREEAPAYGFSPDAEFPIIHAEKGTIRFQYHIPAADHDILSLEAGTRLNVVPELACAVVRGITSRQVLEKAAALPVKVHFECREREDHLLIQACGVSSHACYPQDGVNAIQGLLLLLDALYPVTDSPLKKTIHALAALLGTETDGQAMGLACCDEVSGSLTLNTAILQDNKDDGVLKFDIRYPVTHSGEALLAILEQNATKLGARYELIQHKPPLYVEKDRPFIKMLQKAYEDCTGQEARCISIGGGTYCRYIKNTVSFGPVFPGQKELAHQCNEFIALEDLRLMAKIYAQAIYNLIR